MRHQGYALVQLMIVLSLMAVFATIAKPVLRWSMRTLTTPPAAARAAQLDAAVATLRRDVWRSVAMAAPSPHDLKLTATDGNTVTWHVGPGDLLQRDERRWAGLFSDATVAVEGAVVRLTVTDGRRFRGGTVTLPSQAMLAGRGS